MLTAKQRRVNQEFDLLQTETLDLDKFTWMEGLFEGLYNPLGRFSKRTLRMKARFAIRNRPNLPTTTKDDEDQ